MDLRTSSISCSDDEPDACDVDGNDDFLERQNGLFG